MDLRGYRGILGYDFLKAHASADFDFPRNALRLDEQLLAAGEDVPFRELPFGSKAYPVVDVSVFAMDACEAVGLVDSASPITLCNAKCDDGAGLFADAAAEPRTTTGVDGRAVRLRGSTAAGLRVGSVFEKAGVSLAVADTPSMAQLGFSDEPFLLLGLDVLGDHFAFDFRTMSLRLFSRSRR